MTFVDTNVALFSLTVVAGLAHLSDRMTSNATGRRVCIARYLMVFFIFIFKYISDYLLSSLCGTRCGCEGGDVVASARQRCTIENCEGSKMYE